MERRHEMKHLLRYYKLLNKSSSIRHHIDLDKRNRKAELLCCWLKKGSQNGVKRVDAVDYYSYKVNKIEDEIDRIKLLE